MDDEERIREQLMVSTKTLLKCLIALISLDIITTLIAVTGTGATELNPLSEMFGFYGFMTLKIIVHAVGFYIIYKRCLPSAPLTTRCATVVLLAVYGGVVASNGYQLVGAVA